LEVPAKASHPGQGKPWAKSDHEGMTLIDNDFAVDDGNRTAPGVLIG
jgi:hypothetical protein